MTLLLSRSDLEDLLDVGGCLAMLRRGFLAEPSSIPAQRVRTDLPGPGTATTLIPGVVEGVPGYTVKVNAKFPGSRPALRGVVCLHDARSGELLALLDSATVTAWRTGLSAAIGTHALARRAARTVTVIGAGAQSELMLRGLGALRAWDRLTVCDTDPGRARDFARRHGGTVAADPRSAALDAGIVLLATWSRTPLLGRDDVGPGTQVTSLGADEPGKAELSPALLASARVLVDDVPLALSMGGPGTAGLSPAGIAGTLSQVLRGEVPGRLTDAEVTVYTPVGLPWQDLALAWAAYHQARAVGRGQEFDLLA